MERLELFREVNVELPSSKVRYPIYIGPHLLKDVGLLQSLIAGQEVLVVTNERVAPYYLYSIQAALTSYKCDIVVLPDGEAYKTLDSVQRIHETLLTKGHTRDTTLIALGGGVIGDITAFAASTYHRGVALIQCPTTLLAAVDASVGGKTGVNYPKVKNAVGTFYHPKAVLTDLNTFKTLAKREYHAGLAEVIKYGLIEGGTFFESLDSIILDAQALPSMIERCCKIKSRIVTEDGSDKVGIRATLNLGHTFAHALESYTGYTQWLHGEAVAIGLYCAALLSHRVCQLEASVIEKLDALLKKAGLPRRIPENILKKSEVHKLYDYMKHDKKRTHDALPFILIQKPGMCYVDKTADQSVVEQVLRLAIQADIT